MARQGWIWAAALVVSAFASAEAGARQPQAAAPETTLAAKSMTLFVFLYRVGPAWKSGQPMEKQALGPHAAYIKDLLDQGSLVGGGRFEGLDGGMAIVKSTDAEAARRMLAADPAVTSGVFVAELRAWTPRFRSPEMLPAR